MQVIRPFLERYAHTLLFAFTTAAMVIAYLQLNAFNASRIRTEDRVEAFRRDMRDQDEQASRSREDIQERLERIEAALEIRDVGEGRQRCR